MLSPSQLCASFHSSIPHTTPTIPLQTPMTSSFLISSIYLLCHHALHFFLLLPRPPSSKPRWEISHCIDQSTPRVKIQNLTHFSVPTWTLCYN